MNLPGSLPISSVGVGFPISVPIAYDMADIDPPEIIGGGPKGSGTTPDQPSLLNIFIIGALIFIVIFALFNIIQLLINIFYESLFRSSTDVATQRDFHIALIKQVTFAFITILILIIYFYYCFR